MANLAAEMKVKLIISPEDRRILDFLAKHAREDKTSTYVFSTGKLMFDGLKEPLNITDMKISYNPILERKNEA